MHGRLSLKDVNSAFSKSSTSLCSKEVHLLFLTPVAYSNEGSESLGLISNPVRLRQGVVILCVSRGHPN